MGKVIQFATDTLKALVGGLGDPGRDKAAGLYYGIPVITPDQVINAYRVSWLAKKVVDIPALDSCRNWRSWQAGEAKIEKIEAEERRLGVRAKVLSALIKARLFGGSAIYIGTGESDPAKPLTPESVKAGGIKYLNVMTCQTVIAGQIENDPGSPFYGKPRNYTLSGSGRAVEIHPSRLVIFSGAPLPDDTAINTSAPGWGDHFDIVFSRFQITSGKKATP